MGSGHGAYEEVPDRIGAPRKIETNVGDESDMKLDNDLVDSVPLLVGGRWPLGYDHRCWITITTLQMGGVQVIAAVSILNGQIAKKRE